MSNIPMPEVPQPGDFQLQSLDTHHIQNVVSANFSNNFGMSISVRVPLLESGDAKASVKAAFDTALKLLGGKS